MANARLKYPHEADPDFLSLVEAKIDVPGNDPIDLAEGRKQELNRQLEGQP